MLFLALCAIHSGKASASCAVNCEPNGECQAGKCVCESGFAGVDCSFPFQTCPDNILTCYDGAECTRLSMRLEDGTRSQYQCNCSTVPDASPFQIDECQAPESEACVEGEDTSDYAFCTNGGKCIKKIQYGEPHAGCRCPDEFEGRHCQYRKGTAPDAEIKIAFEEKEHHIEGFIIFLIVLVVAVAFGGLVCMIQHLRSRRLAATAKELDETLNEIALEEISPPEENTKGEIA